MRMESFYEKFSLSDIKNKDVRNDLDNINFSNKDKDFLQSILKKFKEYSLDDVERALILYTYKDKDEAIKFCRKKGVFSYRDCDCEEPYATECLKLLKKYKVYLELTEESEKYICDKLHYEWIAQVLMQEEKNIDVCIRTHERESKTLQYKGRQLYTALDREVIAYIECFFLLRNVKGVHDEQNLDVLWSYSNEDIASAGSYLIYRYKELKDTSDGTSSWMDADYVASHDIEELIIRVCKYLKLREWDLLWDYYGYQISSDNGCLNSPDETLEKSIQLGYIMTSIQEELFFNKCFKSNNKDDKKTTSYMNLFYSLLKMDEEGYMLKFVDEGNFRRCKFYSIDEILKQLGRYEDKTCLFDEDVAMLNYLEKELVMSDNDVFTRKITENANVIDTVVFHRLFGFYYMHYLVAVEQSNDYKNIINSMGVMMSKDKLCDLLDCMVNDRKKTEELVDLLTYKNGRFDIQYTPFLPMKELLCIPVITCAVSNVVRNSIAYMYQQNDKNVFEFDSGKELEQRCSALFCKYKDIFEVRTDLSIEYRKQKSDIDVLAVTDNEIFIIECKNPLLPTDAFSMRSEYDCLEKANKQLNFTKNALADKEFCDKYFKSIGIEYKERKIYTCIMLGNRIFTGYRGLEHPVRNIHIFKMLMETGRIILHSLDKVINEKRIWRKENFQIEDLLNFLSEDKFFVKNIMLDAMLPYAKTIRFDKNEIKLTTYKYNVLKTINNISQV